MGALSYCNLKYNREPWSNYNAVINWSGSADVINHEHVIQVASEQPGSPRSGIQLHIHFITICYYQNVLDFPVYGESFKVMPLYEMLENAFLDGPWLGEQAKIIMLWY